MEILTPDGEHDRQADGGPDGIAPADPVPEAEDTVWRDAEGGNLVECGGNGGEMRGDGLFAKRAYDPLPGGACVGHRLHGRKSFRGDDDQGAGRVQVPDGVGEMGAIHIGDEVDARAVMVGGEGLGDHDGAEIRAADADIDDVGERLAVGGGNRAAADGFREGVKLFKRGVDARHDVLAVHEDGGIGPGCGVRCAERRGARWH